MGDPLPLVGMLLVIAGLVMWLISDIREGERL